MWLLRSERVRFAAPRGPEDAQPLNLALLQPRGSDPGFAPRLQPKTLEPSRAPRDCGKQGVGGRRVSKQPSRIQEELLFAFQPSCSNLAAVDHSSVCGRVGWNTRLYCTRGGNAEKHLYLSISMCAIWPFKFCLNVFVRSNQAY